MNCIRLALMTLAVTLLPVVGFGSPAEIGSMVADTYAKFAPLYSLYKAYGDYEFTGSTIDPPANLDETCKRFAVALSDLQILLVTQTDSFGVEPITRIARLRQQMQDTCSKYSNVIEDITNMKDWNPDIFSQAADKGLFVAISDANSGFRKILDSILEDLGDNDKQWVFSAAFSLRTILIQDDFERIDPSLKDILLGSEDTPPPPKDLPKNIQEKIAALVNLCGQDLCKEEQHQAADLARAIYSFLIEQHWQTFMIEHTKYPFAYSFN